MTTFAALLDHLGDLLLVEVRDVGGLDRVGDTGAELRLELLTGRRVKHLGLDREGVRAPGNKENLHENTVVVGSAVEVKDTVGTIVVNLRESLEEVAPGLVLVALLGEHDLLVLNAEDKVAALLALLAVLELKPVELRHTVVLALDARL
eukprot:CAMPEP_0171511592 /NCGR_PEP_ID=MMETSP0959-20130129/1080_1 /TAXON_ID=87120 /ORGANISM="Aurantiochytrium limacinum, Strain ATCCMYA-1381" /LENGTH=148 /DNA_ID=CAMNT_0012049235 /DNA_START=224 /DNA_END=671 /DNA_ORIENTATION=-